MHPHERKEIERRAAVVGLRPGDYLRAAGLHRPLPPPPVPAINREEYSRLARLAANLNQITHAMNCGRPVTVPGALLEQTAHELRRLRLALLGRGEGADS